MHLKVNKEASSKYSLQIRKTFLAQDNEVSLVWVPEHEDIKGNTVADELSRKDSERYYIGPEPICGITKLRIPLGGDLVVVG